MKKPSPVTEAPRARNLAWRRAERLALVPQRNAPRCAGRAEPWTTAAHLAGSLEPSSVPAGSLPALLVESRIWRMNESRAKIVPASGSGPVPSSSSEE